MTAENAAFPFPGDPVLRQAAEAIEQTGNWGWIVDDGWRLRYATTATRITYAGGTGSLADYAIGKHFFSPEALTIAHTWRFGPNSVERMQAVLEGLGGWVLADTPGPGQTTLPGTVTLH